MNTYTLADEPRPGGLAHLSTSPFWPLLSIMVVGPWFGLPWFALNGFAMGSATRKRELLIVALVLVAKLAVIFLGLVLIGMEALPERALSYVAIAGDAVHLGGGYALYMRQQESFSLYEYYGGIVRNGLFVLILARVFLQPLVEELLHPALALVLA